jgi:hypothetical protein
VINDDGKIIPMEKGQAFMAPYRGYFVPDSTMNNMLNELAAAKIKSQ